MTRLPARLKPARSGIERGPKREWPSHLAFVRGRGCCVPGCQVTPIEAAHVRLGGNAGTALKPPDWQTISLCWIHHNEQHNTSHAEFDRRYGIDSLALAAEFARQSPCKAMREAMREAMKQQELEAAHG